MGLCKSGISDEPLDRNESLVFGRLPPLRRSKIRREQQKVRLSAASVCFRRWAKFNYLRRGAPLDIAPDARAKANEPSGAARNELP